MRPDIDAYFIDMAKLAASRSTCIRRSVGCVLVNVRNHVLATGYNGVPAGSIHCNEVEVLRGTPIFPHACIGHDARSGTGLDSCLAVHAEQNAILQCADAYKIAKAYVTAFPCPPCLKLLLNTSCREIVYLEPYGDGSALDTWVAAGRIARQYGGEPPMLQRDLIRMFDDDLNEWRVLIACICLNLCSARVARGVVMRILNRWPRPKDLALADAQLERYLQPLGLSDRRAVYLRKMSGLWGAMALEDLPGVGPYALESVRVFCDGALPERVGDRKVAAWVEWSKAQKK